MAISMDHLDPAAIRNIVFDLGGVLYAIDPGRTATALHALAGPQAQHADLDHSLFLDFEMGRVTPTGFRNELRTLIDSTASDALLDAAWNALLLGPIAGRLEWIRQLAPHFRIILLSNTNVIHQEIWGPECLEMFGLMEHTWFSFELGMRKPNAEIYQHVLTKMGMNPSESVFLDDSVRNLVGAEAVGMQTLLVDPLSDEQFTHFCLEFLSKV